MERTNVKSTKRLIQKARNLTGLKSETDIVHRALELLVRTETRKGILRYYASGIWRGRAKKKR